MPLTPGFLLILVSLVFVVLNVVYKEKWPLWPAVLCLGLAMLVGR